MKRFRRILVAMSAVAARVTFLGYQNEIGRARDAARRNSELIDTDMDPIEYAEAGDGVPLLSIHGAGGGFDQGPRAVQRNPAMGAQRARPKMRYDAR